MADPKHLLGLIREAVETSLDTNEPVGVVLSGGVDSSTVAALAGDTPTFTGYYNEPGFSELQYSRLVGAGEHHEILIVPQDVIDYFDDMVPSLAPPYQGMGTFGQYMVGKHLAECGIKVALSGEGSDELFGGYPRLLAVAGEKLPDNYPTANTPAGYPTTLEDALAYDYDRLPDLLAVDDQCMAAHNVEARAPFTDNRIVDYVLGLPARDRVAKRLLREAVRGVVPDRIIDRTDNMGFPIPLNKWAQGPLRDWVHDRIGYTPDPGKPWDRTFWHDLLNAAAPASIAA
jgi:asparagine synthase (glutamine-hydrolysing)